MTEVEVKNVARISGPFPDWGHAEISLRPSVRPRRHETLYEGTNQTLQSWEMS